MNLHAMFISSETEHNPIRRISIVCCEDKDLVLALRHKSMTSHVSYGIPYFLSRDIANARFQMF
jgi:hypothetical protein